MKIKIKIYLQHTIYKFDLVHTVIIFKPSMMSIHTKLSLIKIENVKVMWQYTDKL